MELLDQYVKYQNICIEHDKIEKELLRSANSYTSANSLAPILTKEDAFTLINSLAIQFYTDTTAKV